MPIPWLRVLDAVLSLSEVARRVNRPAPTALANPADAGTTASGAPGAIEARLAGVVVAALKEAFDRDHQRLQLERDHRDAERKRAERTLRLELLRQTGDREVARQRMVAGIAVATWLAALLFAGLVTTTVPARIVLGGGTALLLASLASAMLAQARVAEALGHIDDDRDDRTIHPAGGAAGAAAPWLLVAGLATIAVGVLIR